MSTRSAFQPTQTVPLAFFAPPRASSGLRCRLQRSGPPQSEPGIWGGMCHLNLLGPRPPPQAGRLGLELVQLAVKMVGVGVEAGSSNSRAPSRRGGGGGGRVVGGGGSSGGWWVVLAVVVRRVVAAGVTPLPMLQVLLMIPLLLSLLLPLLPLLPLLRCCCCCCCCSAAAAAAAGCTFCGRSITVITGDNSLNVGLLTVSSCMCFFLAALVVYPDCLSGLHRAAPLSRSPAVLNSLSFKLHDFRIWVLLQETYRSIKQEDASRLILRVEWWPVGLVLGSHSLQPRACGLGFNSVFMVLCEP